ncbi:hypothetical protein ROT00_00315 [Agromyces mediolanus]|uniref:hypothetical protein n=1 Tax=Agromyces mediolanus TaxID=41986 RepID=UPI003834613A
MDVSTLSLGRFHEALGILIERYQRFHGTDEVRIDFDYYWNVPRGERYDPTQQPSGLTIGQLLEDADFLQSAVEDPQVTGYPLVWLAHLIEAAGVAADRAT